MNIHDRYVTREFLGYLALALIGVSAIVVFVDVFEKIDVFLDHKAPPGLILRFYLYRLPWVLVQFMPVSLLLATFLALGQLNKFGELTAMRVSGRSLVTILGPVFVIAAAATASSFVLSEVVEPWASRERDRIYDEQIQGMRREQVNERADVTLLGEGGRIFYVRLYLISERRMHEVSLQEFVNGQLQRRIDAAEATWDGRRWVFASGYVRTFDGEREQVRPIGRMAVGGIAEGPEDFAKESRNPEEMNVVELDAYIARLRASGARVANYLVDLHLKLALPLINLIVVAIGASIATRLRMQSTALGFGLSIVIAFVYYAFIQSGQALGYSGALPPWLGAWLGDLVFGVVAIAMLLNAQRR